MTQFLTPPQQHAFLKHSVEASRRQRFFQALMIAYSILGLGCVDLKAPWILHPRMDSAVLGGSTSTGGTPDSGGLPGEDAPGLDGLPATGGVVATGGVIGNDGGQADTDPATGGTLSDDAAIDAPASTGGTPGSGGTSLGDAGPDLVVTGGSTTVDAPIATGGALTTGGAITGGAVATGGAIATGGTIPPYTCSTPLVLSTGTVTNFSDWNSATSTWGTAPNLSGRLFQYQSGGATISPLAIEGTPTGLHLVGTFPEGSYGGSGLNFIPCTDVKGFTRFSYSLYGKAQGCVLETMIQTFDQRPANLSPAGGCLSDGGMCYLFPGFQMNLDSPSAIPATSPDIVARNLSEFRGWSDGKAVQVIGLQWQLTPISTNCVVDITITNIRFQ